MRATSKALCFLALLSLTVALVRCGRKSSDKTEPTTPEAAPYAPAGWSGDADWQDNALKVEDIAP